MGGWAAAITAQALIRWTQTAERWHMAKVHDWVVLVDPNVGGSIDGAVHEGSVGRLGT